MERDLTRSPPAYVISAEIDPLHDEAERYGMQLRAAGMPTEIIRRPGMNRGCLFWIRVVAGADAAMAETCGRARQRRSGMRATTHFAAYAWLSACHEIIATNYDVGLPDKSCHPEHSEGSMLAAIDPSLCSG